MHCATAAAACSAAVGAGPIPGVGAATGGATFAGSLTGAGGVGVPTSGTLSSGVEVIEEITCRTVSRSASEAEFVYLRSLRPKITTASSRSRSASTWPATENVMVLPLVSGTVAPRMTSFGVKVMPAPPSARSTTR